MLFLDSCYTLLPSFYGNWFGRFCAKNKQTNKPHWKHNLLGRTWLKATGIERTNEKNHNTTNWKSRSSTETVFGWREWGWLLFQDWEAKTLPSLVRVFQVSWGLAAAPGLATKWPSQAVNATPQICPGDFPKKVLNQEFAEVFWPTRQTLCQSFLCWLDYSCHEWESVQAESFIQADSSKRCVNLRSRTLNSFEIAICISSFEAESENAFCVVLLWLHWYQKCLFA